MVTTAEAFVIIYKNFIQNIDPYITLLVEYTRDVHDAGTDFISSMYPVIAEGYQRIDLVDEPTRPGMSEETFDEVRKVEEEKTTEPKEPRKKSWPIIGWFIK